MVLRPFEAAAIERLPTLMENEQTTPSQQSVKSKESLASGCLDSLELPSFPQVEEGRLGNLINHELLRLQSQPAKGEVKSGNVARHELPLPPPMLTRRKTKSGSLAPHEQSLPPPMLTRRKKKFCDLAPHEQPLQLPSLTLGKGKPGNRAPHEQPLPLPPSTLTKGKSDRLTKHESLLPRPTKAMRKKRSAEELTPRRALRCKVRNTSSIDAIDQQSVTTAGVSGAPGANTSCLTADQVVTSSTTNTSANPSEVLDERLLDVIERFRDIGLTILNYQTNSHEQLVNQK
jgi:hypothetical protein